MENKSDTENGATAVLLLQIGKREGENEDEPQESAKKQKRDEAAEEQRNTDEIVSDNSFSDSEPDMTVKSSENSAEGIEEDSKTPEDATMLSTLNEEYAGSKTICAKNLSYSVERTDLEDLFKECGEIVDIRLHTDREGRFKGFGHIEFASAEAAKKALQLNYTELLRCRIRIRIAQPKHKYTSNRSFHVNLSNSIQRTEKTQPMKGSEISLDYEQEAQSKIHSTLEAQKATSKTIYAANLAYSVEKTDMEFLFKECGEIVDILLHTDDKGLFKGYAHVKFTTAQAAKKAVELNRTIHLGRRIRVEIAHEKGEYSSNKSNWSNSFQKCERDQSPTIYVNGFNSSLPVEKIKASLEKHFGSCGEIARISIPTFRESGDVRGFAHLEFKHVVSVNKALHLDQSELGGYRLRVEKEKPRRENQGIGGGRGGGRREFGGRDSSGYSSKMGWEGSSGGWHSLHFSDESTGRKNQFQ